jgi:hypothetical protein
LEKTVMAGPADWGAVPVTPPPGEADGPAAWGARPLDQEQKPLSVGAVEGFFAPFAGIPSEQRKEAEEGLQRMEHGIERAIDVHRPWSEIPRNVKLGLGEAALGGLQYATSYPTGFVRSLVGKPYTEASTAGLEAAGVPKPYAELIGQTVGGTLEAGASMVAPEVMMGMKFKPLARQGAPRIGSSDVVATEGEATQDPVKLAWERKARSGELGTAVQNQALQFEAERAPKIAEEAETVRRSFDPQGQVRAQGPLEAAEVAQQAIQRQAGRAKAATDAAYLEARGIPGEIDAIAFGNMGSGIREELRIGTEPVFVDRATTPNAYRMVRMLDQQPSALARDLGIRIPEGEQIAGLPLNMVDLIRKRLSGMRRSAFASAGRDASDARAAAKVLDAFDERIDSAVNTGLFRGDDAVIDAWRAARAQHADYRAIFRKGGRRDTVGDVMEKIVGRHGTPAAIAEDVSKWAYGASQLTPTSLNVAVMRRMRNTIGANTPEFTAVRQGMFSRLIETPPGVSEITHGKVADRIYKFLDGSLAPEIYTQPQRDMLRAYADFRRTLKDAPVNVPVPQQRLIDRVMQYTARHAGRALGAAVGAKTGFPLAGLPVEYGVQKAAERIPDIRNVRQAQKQFPIIGKALLDYQKAISAYEVSRSARNIARVSLAVRNLDRNLRDIGTSVNDLMSNDTGGDAGAGTSGSEQSDRARATVPMPAPQGVNRPANQ